jgi:hypothetical protein
MECNLKFLIFHQNICAQGMGSSRPRGGERLSGVLKPGPRSSVSSAFKPENLAKS